MKAVKLLKQGSFFLILILTGICFLTIDDFRQIAYAEGENWRMYVQPGYHTASGNDVSGNGASVSDNGEAEYMGDGDTVQSVSGGDVSSGDAAPGGQQPGVVSGGDSSAAVPKTWKYTTVEESYFDDAVFIGDSRTVGLFEYAGLDNSTFYASTGLTVYKMFDAPIVPVEGSKKKITIEEALQQRQFAKIYFMIGINEMGTGTVDTFIEKYKEQVKHLQELQPNATIYLQAIMKVSTERSSQGDYINNAGIDARNAKIAELADNEKIFYLDVNPLICDPSGGMVSEYTFDGIHLKAKYILTWTQFLMEHAVEWSSP